MEPFDTIARELAEAHPSDAADIVSGMGVEVATPILSTLGVDRAATTLAHLPPHVAARYLSSLPPKDGGAILNSLSAVAAARLLRWADSGVVDAILAEVENPDAIREQLRYPVLSVGEAMDPNVLAVPSHFTIAQVRKVISDATRSPYLYVVDSAGALIGVLHAEKLDQLPDSKVETVMSRSVVRLQAYSPLESVLDHPAWNEYDVLPVTGRMNVLVGRIRHKDLRRHGVPPAGTEVGDESFGDAVLSLGELYWSSLWKVVYGLAPARVGPAPNRKETP